ncbi:hypothetical protein IAQ61_003160 [Plenodomus lingam]|uniref:uncharacterized protein n=1 Tax=Leptosphaeria maculans TaxID=5022 RepID=UPI00332B3508|nr:hypothetical protein IAQ61_003160 [Plenodomus lingam]
MSSYAASLSDIGPLEQDHVGQVGSGTCKLDVPRAVAEISNPAMRTRRPSTEKTRVTAVAKSTVHSADAER